ncbi:hypothetical protein HO173_002221 [Letharia columbiana]|uniref:PHD-type domain-containing protein n=1 Tax=Letharia columbiana TaxID=112416 RepID=A0A8H6L8Q5_9LECA|nr:uncharacterized protein HO173_002221 [Letharia columbiana]KAF6239675.1 hypothetical protein HO173_002221 [Letharia columbiana]
MSSTTEDSDWNMSPKSRRPHSLSNTDTVRPTSQPVIPRQSPTSQVDSSALSTPRAGSFASTATQIEKQLESQLSQAVATTFPSAHAQPAVTPSSAILPNPALTIPNADGSILINQNTPEWEAAREAVLSQMVTSQDITATPTPKVTRGGVKTGGRRGRGGRRTKVKIEEPDDTPPKNLDAPVRAKNKGGRPRGSRAGGTPRGGRGGTPGSGRGGATPGSVRAGVNKGGRPRGSRAGHSAAALAGRLIGRGIKRKRKKGDDDDDDEKDDTDASEEFTPIAATSSGRRINQVKTFSPVVLDPVKGLSNKTPQSAARAPVPEPPSTARKTKKRRKPGEAAVCINCGRGHSPNSNMIVFCDGCSTPWHQYCHDRPITPSFIQIEEKEWNCAECTVVQEEKMHLTGKVSAGRMSLSEKRTYLQNLEKAELVSLLLHASTLHEDLPVFGPPPPPPPVQVLEPTADEEELYVYVEPDPLPYPKAGNGLLLPPEDDDLDILIDEDIVTYSHLWKGPAGWEGPNGMRWPFPPNGIGARGVMGAPIHQIGVGA